jgi:hypothetical protein
MGGRVGEQSRLPQLSMMQMGAALKRKVKRTPALP